MVVSCASDEQERPNVETVEDALDQCLPVGFRPDVASLVPGITDDAAVAQVVYDGAQVAVCDAVPSVWSEQPGDARCVPELLHVEPPSSPVLGSGFFAPLRPGAAIQVSETVVQFLQDHNVLQVADYSGLTRLECSGGWRDEGHRCPIPLVKVADGICLQLLNGWWREWFLLRHVS